MKGKKAIIGALKGVKGENILLINKNGWIANTRQEWKVDCSPKNERSCKGDNKGGSGFGKRFKFREGFARMKW